MYITYKQYKLYAVYNIVLYSINIRMYLTYVPNIKHIPF